MIKPARRVGIRSLLQGTYRYAYRYRATLIFLAIGLLFETLYEVGVRYALKYIIDLAVVERDFTALVAVLLILGAGAIVFNFVVIGCDYAWAKTGGRIINDIRSDMFTRLQSLSTGYHNRKSTGDLLARFNADVGHVDTGMVLGFPMAAMGVVEILVTVSLMFFVHPVLCAVALAGIAFSLVVPYLLQRRAVTASFALRESEGHMVADLEEKLRGQNIIKAFGLEFRAREEFRSRLDDVLRRRVKADFLSYLVTRIPSLVFLLLLLVVLAMGGWLAINGEITIGELVAYQALLIGLNTAIYNLTWTIPSFVEATAAWRRIREVLDEPVTLSDLPNARVLDKAFGAIEFENVSFTYAGSQSRTLKDVSIKIRAGEYVAVVGPSGAGKSSIINLLMRFHDVGNGRLLIDGQDVRNLTLQSLRAQIGFVSQDVMLFDTSVRDNILLGAPSASDDDIVEAAKAAEIHSRILMLEDGYATRVGPRGFRLSGGERQRIALARALVRKPALLALDEFSSSLDPATQRGILDTIRKLRGTCTIVSITHRHTVAVSADRVIVLRDGCVVETGRPADLIRREGEFRRLWAHDDNAI